MSRRTLRARRGSALILVLLMTLAVAALAVAAIFLSSSAGLLSRFYDQERDYRLAAESALEIVRAELGTENATVIPDTGIVQLAAGLRVPAADGTLPKVTRVNVYAAWTGDTTGASQPTLSLLAAAYDPLGTRHVRRMDLRRESFAGFGMFVDEFPSTVNFGPGILTGRIHSNGDWRSATGSDAPVLRGRVTAVGSISGAATILGDTATGVPVIPYPHDSIVDGIAALASGANLAIDPVSGSPGYRVHFVTVDVNGNGQLEDGEGFLRVFDLAAGMSRRRINLGGTATALQWDDPIVQNQCGAFYLRNGRWHFFPVSTHRATWAQSVIQATGAGNEPMVTNPEMTAMAAFTAAGAETVLRQPTSRCFPAGSSFLMTAERRTNSAGVITGTVADTVPFGVVVPAGGWPASAPTGYGGSDTTFTAVSRSCRISAAAGGRCLAGTDSIVGQWRSYAGTQVSGVATSIRQAAELAFLWRFSRIGNSSSQGVVSLGGDTALVAGSVRGRVTMAAAGTVLITESLTQARDAAAGDEAACANSVGIIARGDVLVADNALTRGRSVSAATTFTRRLGASNETNIHASLMSLTGTVGVQNPGAATNPAAECPSGSGITSSGGCYRLNGAAIMKRASPFWSGAGSGFRWDGSPTNCGAPPHFPPVGRFAPARTVEIAPSRANTPNKVRALLLSLRGAPL